MRRTRIILRGDVPSPVDPPGGCRFHPRCPLRERLGSPAICADAIPALTDLGTDHLVACHFRGPDAEARMADARTSAATDPEVAPAA
jgi:ABC-type dipeptide/oligopeptide/nickel transport system ATPase component